MLSSVSNSPPLSISSCRICLQSVREGELIRDKSDLLQLYEFCFDLTILPEERARMLCIDCINYIKSYSQFKKQCHKSNEIWKSFQLRDLKCYNEKYLQLHQFKTEPLCVDNHNDSSIDNDFLYEEEVPCDIKPEPGAKNDLLQSTVKEMSFKNTNIKSQRKKSKPKSDLEPVQKQNYLCGICNISSQNKQIITEHLSVHWSNNDLKCSLCDTVGEDVAFLLTHRYKHYPKESNIKGYSCHMCDKKCGSFLSLEFHYRSVHLKKPGGFCSLCGKTFSIFITWKKHERLHKIERFICNHCGKKFLYKTEIESHLVDHGDTRNYVCETCGKSFKRKSALKLHRNSVHSSKPVKCSHCDKVFKSQTTLNEHMKRVGSNRPFVCVHCGKNYRLPSALRSHMFWHSGERPHVCEMCGLKYKSKAQLKVHKRNHTGYFPFKCSQCDKCFTSSQPLKRHQSIHTGVRAHKCNYCERTFHERKTLKEHCVLTHKDKLNVKLELSKQ